MLSRREFIPAVVATALAPSLLLAEDVASTAPANGIRVMSFNLRNSNADDGENSWPHRTELVFKTIESFNPDLLGVQECLPVQAKALQDRLKDYGFVGVGREDGKQRGEMAAVFFRSARFEKGRDGTFWLSPTPEIPGSKGWDAALTRICTWVELRDKNPGGRSVYFFNTHWDHKGVQARRESAKVMHKQIRGISGDAPVIVTGDFNIPDDSTAHADLVEPEGNWRLVDAYRTLHPKHTADDYSFHGFTGQNHHAPAGPKIDWILHTSHFTTKAAEIDRAHEGSRYPSDHFPVTAEIAWVTPTSSPAR